MKNINREMSTNKEIYSTIREKGDCMKKNKKGFTLVEIIVVLVIIGILMALAVPAVMSYVNKAAETKLISEARSVMVASKEKGIELVKVGKLDELSSTSNKTDIIQKSEIEDGELMEIQLNAAKNGSGDFVVKIDDVYIRYDDARQNYEVLDTYDDFLSKAESIHDTFINETVLEAINNYFETNKITNGAINSEDSENSEYYRKILMDSGIVDNDNYSFRIYQHTGSGYNDYTITISERKITSDDIINKNKVKVIQFNYAGNGGFTGTPQVRTATTSVKEEKNSTNNTTYPALNLGDSNIKWEVITDR